MDKNIKILLDNINIDENSYQYQFPCPNCVERDGWMEARKYNLEVNLQKQVFKCWKCCSIDEHMSGSIIKLIRMHGNEKLLQEYKDVIHEIIYEFANTSLLPEDFDKRSPDNMILSVALKYKDDNPIMLTSDNGLQLKCKIFSIATVSLRNFLKR